MLYEGQIVDQTYRVKSEIGAGGMGVVYLAYHLRLNKYVVMKKLKNATSDMEMLRNEVDILKSLHHTYLPQVYDFITYDGDVYTIIDYIEGYDLKYYIDNGIGCTEGQLIKWFRQLCEVLEYIHSREPRVLHMDIKPANIIVRSDGDICLIDFGISLYGGFAAKGISNDYASPEQYTNVYWIEQGYPEYAASVAPVDEQTDIYSLGASFYHLMTGIKPICTEPLYPVSKMNIPYVSDSFAEIIDRAICFEKEKRFLSATQMLKAVKNIFKMTAGYKLYFWMQIISSLLAAVMIVSGAVMVITDIGNRKRASFNEDYLSFISAVSTTNVDRAESLSAKLLGGEYDNSVVNSDTKAEIYHGLGECYFESGDYFNAVECYRKASETMSDTTKAEEYYRDYAIALVYGNDTAKAQEVLDRLNGFVPDSASSYMIKAQLHFISNQLSEAKEELKTALQYAGDDDIRFTAYMLLGDIYVRESQDAEAEFCFENALAFKENASVLRKLGSVKLSLGNKKQSQVYYASALECFRTIYEQYVPTEDDVINLSQACLLMKDADSAQKCIEMLNEYMKQYGETCRVYIMLATAANECSDARVRDYCLKAHYLYTAASEQEKESIDKESLATIRNLYRYYLKEAW